MKRIVAIKNVTINEPFFAGHFPEYPIMPGVLVVEAIAQAGGALLMNEIPDRESKLMVFTGIERAKFRRPSSPATSCGSKSRCSTGGPGRPRWKARPSSTASSHVRRSSCARSFRVRQRKLPAFPRLPRNRPRSRRLSSKRLARR